MNYGALAAIGIGFLVFCGGLVPALAEGAKVGRAFTTETIRCPAALTPTETEGKTYHCGVVYVPENHDKPEGRILELTFLVLHSTSMTPEPDPVVYLSGGPGGIRAIRNGQRRH